MLSLHCVSVGVQCFREGGNYGRVCLNTRTVLLYTSSVFIKVNISIKQHTHNSTDKHRHKINQGRNFVDAALMTDELFVLTERSQTKVFAALSAFKFKGLPAKICSECG